MSARLAVLARQTVAIVHNGGYVAPGGDVVTIGDDVARAASGTHLYLPDDALPDAESRPDTSLRVEITPESTLEAGRRLGPGTAALVFASARNPGGGFLNGARAQEEDIARASALHECLRTVPDFYAHHRREPDLRYSDRVIYCPEVPVFRDADGTLLEEAYGLSFLVAAAPNLGAILAQQPDLAGTVPAALNRRAERVLRVAAAHGHRRIVLGAWGCGVFRNPPEIVAEAWRHALTEVPAFEHVVFAILDRTGDGPTFRAFLDAVRSWPRRGEPDKSTRPPTPRSWTCPGTPRRA
jgi:uncharacterized protein (TIGR02452 family)